MEKTVDEALDELIRVLDRSSIVRDYQTAKEAVLRDSALKKEIASFHAREEVLSEQEKEAKRKRIYQKDTFRIYKKRENEVFYLILALSRRFQSRIHSKECIK